MSAQQRKGGGPSQINPQRIQRLLEAVAAGNYIDASARMASLNPSTVYTWARHGKAAIDAAAEFVDDPEQVIADWLDQFPDNFKADNLMWIMEPPEGFEHKRWIHALFYCRFEKAKSVAEVAALQNIIAAGRSGNWQASAWFLERTRPDKYGRKIVEHQGSETGPAVKVQTVDSETLFERISALAKGETK